MVVNPWGEVRLDAGSVTGVHVVTLNLSEVAEARRRIPSLLKKVYSKKLNNKSIRPIG